MRAKWVVAWLALIGLGCPASEPHPAEVEPPEAAGRPLPHPRRPSTQWLMVRTGPRCEVRRVDAGEHVTKVDDDACPLHLEVGERIRLAGKTCMREGGAADRELPVVCPDSLTNAEKRFLAAQTGSR